MRRREFITFLGCAAIMWSRAARAQQPGVPVIGYLNTGSRDVANPDIEAAFDRGLGESGYVVGRNVTIERRWAGGNYDKLPELALELVRLNPALIVVGGNVAALAARRATSTIPIVFNIASDPVKLGLAKSFSHPGGNATGIALMTATLTLKRLELIRELIPQNSTVGLLVNPDNQDVLQEIEDAGGSTGRSLEVALARNLDDLEPAFTQLVSAQVGAIIVSNDAFFLSQRVQLVALATRHSLPASYEWREFPAVGGLMSYGPSLPGTYQKIGTYAARILKGTQPSDLPIQQPTEISGPFSWSVGMSQTCQ
jgi:putative tryptophan/tyrosine transport system substrate-binding protein